MTETEQKTVLETPVKNRNRRSKLEIRIADILILALIIVVCCIHAVFQLTNSVGATVMLCSVSSENGRNPDGTPFSIMELFESEVLDRASEKLNGQLSAQELRNHLAVSDTMSGTSYSQLHQSVLDGAYENTYFPTGYLVTYSTVSEQIRNEGFLAQYESIQNSFSLPSKTEILNAVLESYQEYYAEKHLNYDSLFQIDWSAADAMDYYNRAEFMNNTVLRILRFLQYKDSNHMNQAEVYDNAEYLDLIVEITQGPYQNIATYRAYVIQNGVTNNKDALMRQFSYMQNLYEEENSRKMHEYTVLREAIEMYDASTTKVVFIPALDDENAFYMNRTKVGVDYLTEQADRAKVQAETAEYAAEHYSYLRDCFGQENMSNESGERKNTSVQRTHADELYASIKGEIQRLTAETAMLAEEGNQLNLEELRIGEPTRNVSMLGVAMSSAKRFALLLMSAYVIVYVARTIAAKKRKGYRE